jgi:Ca-activated chloride channel family protein
VSVSASGIIEGLFLKLSLTQLYKNDSPQELEIVYTFPLAYGATLLGLEANLGGVTLVARVTQNQIAKQKYEEAIDMGDAPILLTESSPGLYTANLGNIRPGQEAAVVLRNGQLLRVEGGKARVTIPTTIGYRYGDRYSLGELKPHETDAVSPEARYPFSVSIGICGETARARVSSPSHRIGIKPGQGALEVSTEGQAYLNRDFVLSLEGLDGLRAAHVAPDGEGYAALATFCPEFAEGPRSVSVKILADCSGSMKGHGIASSRLALGSLIPRFQASDYVSLSRFGSAVKHGSLELLPATPEGLAPGETFLKSLAEASGGAAELVI